MNYDLITKASAFTVVALILVFVLKNYIDGVNKERQSHEKQRQNYNQLVTSVRKESKEREDKLYKQLDKYNESLQEISENIKVIPAMQEDLKAIPKIQADIDYLKERVK